MPDETNWMSGLDGNTRVSSIVMPGSHDAGVAKTNVELNYGFKEAWAVCQHGSISDQALSGSRFFDCRVFYQAQAQELEFRHELHSLGKRAHLPQAEFNAYHDMGVHDVTKNRFRFGHFSGERKDNAKHGALGVHTAVC